MLMKQLLLIPFLVCSLLSISLAQTFEKQRRQFIVNNIGVNALLGGVGALINKKPNEKPLKVFLKGAGQGALGSGFQVLANHNIYNLAQKQKLGHYLLSNFSNSIGSSIVQNAASNRNFWERWHMHYGLLRLDYDLVSRTFQARVSPSTLFMSYFAFQQAGLNIRSSLLTGMLIFESAGPLNHFGTSVGGFAGANVIVINKDLAPNEYWPLFAHEAMHVLQVERYVWANAYLNKTDTKLSNKSKLYSNLKKYIYFDLNGITAWALYNTQWPHPWICRYIEREAELFSSRKALPACF